MFRLHWLYSKEVFIMYLLLVFIFSYVYIIRSLFCLKFLKILIATNNKGILKYLNSITLLFFLATETFLICRVYLLSKIQAVNLVEHFVIFTHSVGLSKVTLLSRK